MILEAEVGFFSVLQLPGEPYFVVQEQDSLAEFHVEVFPQTIR